MIPDIPWTVTVATVAATLIVPVVVWQIVSRGAARAGLDPAARRRVQVGSALVLGLWAVLALVLAPPPGWLAGQDRYTVNPLVPAFALGGIALVLALVGISPALRRSLAAASLPAIVGVQFYRVLGLQFVILVGLGQLPARFGLPAGWGDVAIGLAAPVVALALARGTRGSRAAAITWNVLGLVDLATAVGMGTGWLPLLAGERLPSAAAMGVYPLILVPTFAVPMAVLLHLVALRRLSRARRSVAGTTPGLAGAR
jgi:hypothetical protein